MYREAFVSIVVAACCFIYAASTIPQRGYTNPDKKTRCGIGAVALKHIVSHTFPLFARIYQHSDIALHSSSLALALRGAMEMSTECVWKAVQRPEPPQRGCHDGDSVPQANDLCGFQVLQHSAPPRCRQAQEMGCCHLEVATHPRISPSYHAVMG